MSVKYEEGDTRMVPKASNETSADDPARRVDPHDQRGTVYQSTPRGTAERRYPDELMWIAPH